MSHFTPNSTTYTCHCYFLLLAMTSICDVFCDKHKLNLMHLSQTYPTIHQKKQNFSKNSVMYLTQFCKKFLNTSYECQLCIHKGRHKFGIFHSLIPLNPELSLIWVGWGPRWADPSLRLTSFLRRP